MSSALALPASVTLDEVSAVLAEVESALAAASKGATNHEFTLDASGVTELDSSAVALLLQAQRLAARRGCTLQLRGLPDKLMALATLYGVGSLLASPSTGSA